MDGIEETTNRWKTTHNARPKDEDPMKPISALDLYQATPKTNCKECGHPTCLAFATRVIVERMPLDACPYLGEETCSDLEIKIAKQQGKGVYVKRDQYKITSEFIRERLAEKDFTAVADGLGAEYLEQGGEPGLRIRYLNRDHVLTRQEITLDGVSTGDHWDNILMYNYVHFSGSEPLHHEWIPIDSIPGNIPKKPELEHGCEQKIAAHFQDRRQALERAAETLAGVPDEQHEHADKALAFFPLPRVPFLMLFWDRDPEENFPARTKVLFDRSVTSYLDIESLVFLAEKFAEALIAADEQTGSGTVKN